jgi:hypothetical protein
MKKRTFSTELVGLILVLLTASLLSPFFAWPFSISDLLLNIGSDLLIIIITVLYVERVLKRYGASQWRTADSYISNEARSITIIFFSQLAESHGLIYEIFPKYPDPRLQDKKALEEIVIENTSRIEINTFLGSLKHADQEHLVKIGAHLGNTRNEITNFLNRFTSKLNSNQLEALLRFRQTLLDATNRHSSSIFFLEQKKRAKSGNAEDYAAIFAIELGVYIHDAIKKALRVLEVFEFSRDESGIDFKQEIDKHWSNYRLL